MNNFNDKDILFDLLMTEKSLTSIYNMGITESSGNLRVALREVLDDIYHLQENIFDVLHNHGDYKTPPADMQKVNEARQKHCQCCE